MDFLDEEIMEFRKSAKKSKYNIQPEPLCRRLAYHRKDKEAYT